MCIQASGLDDYWTQWTQQAEAYLFEKTGLPATGAGRGMDVRFTPQIGPDPPRTVRRAARFPPKWWRFANTLANDTALKCTCDGDVTRNNNMRSSAPWSGGAERFLA